MAKHVSLFMRFFANARRAPASSFVKAENISQQMVILDCRMFTSWHPPLRLSNAQQRKKLLLPRQKALYKIPNTHHDYKLLNPCRKRRNIMTPNIVPEAQSHSFTSRTTVAQRKEAHELRKVRTLLDAFMNTRSSRFCVFRICEKHHLRELFVLMFPDSQATHGKEKTCSNKREPQSPESTHTASRRQRRTYLAHIATGYTCKQMAPTNTLMWRFYL